MSIYVQSDTQKRKVEKYKEAGCRGVSRTLYAPEVVQNSKKFK